MSKSKKNLKKPIKKAVAKVPVVMQMEALECGAAALAMILEYYDKWIPLEQVRIDCGVSRDGSNARNIVKAARHYGLNAKGFKFEPEDLKKKGLFPCIIHWEFNHFVVLKGFRGDKVYINDPARGECVISSKTFDEAFTGICILFEPFEEFEPSGVQKNIFNYIIKRVKNCGVAIAFVFLTMIISALLEIINPAFSRIFMDRILPGKNPEWAPVFFAILLGIYLIEIIVEAIKSIYSLKINGKMAIYSNTSYMWKVLRLPIDFFTQRFAGDILQRKENNSTISKDIVESLAPFSINVIMMFFYLFVMVRYSLLLTIIGLGSVIIDSFLANIISLKRINITRVMLRDEGKLYGTTVSGIEMIETIKSSGSENGFFEKWSGYQASVNTQKVKSLKIDYYLGYIPNLISQITSSLVLVIGVFLVMQGEFTVGMIMAFQGFLMSFLGPASSIIESKRTMQEMVSTMERVDDVMQYKEDVVNNDDNKEVDKYSKLSGLLELKNITFGYSKLSEPLIKDFNMKLTPGKTVALVGRSGCGKSTISKLISGLYEPWSGEILFDGKKISDIDRDIFTGSLAVVDQNITLFEDSISENIKMWDKSIEDFEVILAARDAQIHDDIMQRDGGYNYKLLEDGKNLSGGQRQRIEIARVLSQDPTIIIMDEATSALDAKTEFDLVKAVKDRGITSIIVAHRLSTIRDCDEIIVLNHGNVVERGTHEELYAKGGFYAQLVSNE